MTDTAETGNMKAATEAVHRAMRNGGCTDACRSLPCPCAEAYAEAALAAAPPPEETQEDIDRWVANFERLAPRLRTDHLDLIRRVAAPHAVNAMLAALEAAAPPAVTRGREEIARALYEHEFVLNQVTEYPTWEEMSGRGATHKRFLSRADAVLSLSPQGDGWREIVEACAKVAEGWPATFDGPVSSQGRYAAENIAAAIRALPSPPRKTLDEWVDHMQRPSPPHASAQEKG